MADKALGTVLYVDDEEQARKYFARLFGDEFNVVLAEDAEGALETIRNGPPPDVLLTDFRMPGKDGGQLLAEVQICAPQIVCMILSAYADKVMLMNTINSVDVFRIVEKPANTDNLRTQLRKALEAAQLRKNKRQRLMAMDEGLSFLAHEMNTPLLSAVASARGIKTRMEGGRLRAPDCAAVLHAADRVEHSARYCISLLTAFIDSVRAAGMASASRASLPASTVVTSLLDTYPMTPAQRAGVSSVVVQDFDISGSPVCASLVLSSLLGNALRALEGRADMRIMFRIEVFDVPRIVIEDNGPGMTPDVLDQLFDTPVTTASGQGHKGMGMIFCKRIMQSFFGGIEIAARPGAGTQVVLCFPPNDISYGK
ncbi:hybrid sensor histidine kinase/response regulator [Imbroritus primus]|uniref:hybrid sensor histidine kinase/response regulator n=1 Tax=Imbroritus primus TaxID=3058603 RepID=UPI003D160948